MRRPGFERLRKTMRHEARGTERQRDVAVGAGMKIEHGSGLRSEIDDRVTLQDLQDDDLMLDQRGQGRRLPGLVAQSRQVVAGNREDVEALPQALAENEQLDARGIAQRRRFLTHEAMQHESLQVAIDGRLRRREFACELGHADRLSQGREPLQQAQRQVDRLVGRTFVEGPRLPGRPAQCRDFRHAFRPVKQCFNMLATLTVACQTEHSRGVCRDAWMPGGFVSGGR
jgi:hypothetical protein